VLAVIALVLGGFVVIPRAAVPQEGWTRVVEAGFGDPGNTTMTDWAIFKGWLYVGTFATAEQAVWSGSSKSGGDIWRTRDGVTWKQVGMPGLGNPANVGIDFVQFKNRLYAVTTNVKQGLEVWSSADGEKFTKVVSGGFDSSENTDASTWVFRGRLILGTSNSTGAQVWSSADGRDFNRIAVRGLDQTNTGFIAHHFEKDQGSVFHGRLYAGTSNPTRGGEIWRTSDGSSWQKVASAGLGRATNLVLSPSVVFKQRLYATSVNKASPSQPGPIDVFRTKDGTTWERVVEGGFGAGPDENVIGQLDEYKGALLLQFHNTDPRVLTPPSPIERFDPVGFELWRSTDGISWSQVGEAGFGNAANMGSGGAAVAGSFYLAVKNYREGDSIWRSTDGIDWTPTFREQGTTPFSTGAGLLAFNKHLYVVHNDLGKGLEIWRSP
jgi:hypothetical protein